MIGSFALLGRIRRPWFLVLSCLLVASSAVQAGTDLSAPVAHEKSRAGEVTLIDIRTPREWQQTGVAAGALTLDMTRKTFVQDLLASVNGDKNAPIALICRTGNRTTNLQRALESMGFTNVYNVREGMAGSTAGPGWLKRGLPIESCKTC